MGIVMYALRHFDDELAIDGFPIMQEQTRQNNLHHLDDELYITDGERRLREYKFLLIL